MKFFIMEKFFIIKFLPDLKAAQSFLEKLSMLHHFVLNLKSKNNFHC